MKAKLTRWLDWLSLALIALCVAMIFLVGPVIPIAYVEPFQPVWLPLILLLSVTRWLLLPRPAERERPLPEPSPAISATIVILATGFVAAAGLGYRGYEADGWPGLTLPAVIAVLTLAIALAVARFATRHEGEIGEARFDTSNRP